MCFNVFTLMITFIVSFNIKLFKDYDGFVVYQTHHFIVVLNKKKVVETLVIIKNTAFDINFALFIIEHFNLFNLLLFVNKECEPAVSNDKLELFTWVEISSTLNLHDNLIIKSTCLNKGHKFNK